MALGKYSRIDNRKSSSYCSTALIVVFVALCLVGVWMMTSSTVVPADMSSSESKSEVKQKVSENDSREFEDTPGDLPTDAIKEDDSTDGSTSPEESNAESSQGQSTENVVDNTQGFNTIKDNEERKDESNGTPKTQTYEDQNGNTNGGETVKEGGKMNKGGEEDDQAKSTENSPDGTATTEQDKSMEQKPDEIAGNEQERDSQQNSDVAADNEQKTVSEQDSDENVNNEQGKESKHNPNQTSNGEQGPSYNVNKSEQKENTDGDTVQNGKSQGQVEETTEQNQDEGKEKSSSNEAGNQAKDQALNEVFPDGAQAELLNETSVQNGSFSTQFAESKYEKEVQASSLSKDQFSGLKWKLCNVTAGRDYIPCLDNEEAIKKLRSTKHYEHRERHCPEEGPTCLVPLPDGYKRPIEWPKSRDKIWYFNVPHTKLAEVKGHQNWVKVTGEFLTFPGGGTQFKNGALHYIDSIQEALSDIAWGKQSRVVLDVGCGVASFGGYLFDRDVLTMSFAPKDEHEAQVQFALERGIPAISAVMGTTRLPFPGRVFDVIHCARCRVPWHIEGGKLLLELNRLLRPGGYFVWSATPVYRNTTEDVGIWEAMSALTKSMCWDMVTKTKDAVNEVGIAIYKKPTDNECYKKRMESNPPLCKESDDPNAAWNVPLQACMHRLPEDPAVRGSKWPEQWPFRLEKSPYWLNDSQVGVYGKPAPKDFETDYEHWKHVISKSYLNGMGINWSTVRNVMDMRSVYGGFAAALRDMNVWVMNVVAIDSPDTLPIIYERGLFGMYHDWCESFSTYPRTYDLLHADHLFSMVKKRCKLIPVMVEVDRILRPEGKLIVRDNSEIVNEIENIAKSLHWEIRLTYSKEKEGLLCVQKTMWRPQEVEANTQSMS